MRKMRKRIDLHVIKAERMPLDPGYRPKVIFECMIYDPGRKNKLDEFFKKFKELKNIKVYVEWDEE
jgi:hypothetical protein